MSRDHRKLRVFHDSHRLVLAIYQYTGDFPRDEWFGLRSQVRRSAVSVATNLVEGNARRTTAEYVNFLNIALGAACEVRYLVGLAHDLGYLTEGPFLELRGEADAVVRQLERLTQRAEMWLRSERRRP